jgi:enoyl-CoA hydratase
VAIDRPEVRNALDTATRASLVAALDWAASADEVGVVVITGRGGEAFASGADLSEPAAVDPLAVRRSLAGPRVYDAVATCPRPVIAMVDGYCLGGGCELALSADLRVASTRARLGQPEVRLGLIPGGGATQRLPRMIGPGAAMRLILTGEVVDGVEAHRLGLVDVVVPAEQLEEATRTLAASIAVHPADALALAKEAVRASLELGLSAGLARERDLLALALASPDAAEGVAAFRERRRPRFPSRPR